MAAVIDLDHLEKYVAGDEGLRDEILMIFSEQANELVAKFDIECTDEAWRNTAHALKGAARGVGIWRLGDLCEEAEALIGATPGKMEQRAAIMAPIRLVVAEALDEVKSLRSV